MRAGRFVLGAAAVATGIVNLRWGAFDPAEEPIQAWMNDVPHGPFPDLVATLLIVGGVATVWRRPAGWGAVVLAASYLLFALFCMPRLYTAPHYLGWPHAVGAAAGVGQNAIVAAAATMLYASTARKPSRLAKLAEAARWVFGLATITFGLGHFTGISSVDAMIPKWLPPDPTPWAIFTGIAFVLAGIAILCGVLDVLAARLLAIMLLVFSVLVLLPVLRTHPQSHAAWGINVYNLAAIGAALILAEWLADRRKLGKL